MSTDVCVPISGLPNAIIETKKITDSFGIQAAIFGHVGDGNYHAVMSINKDDKEQLKKN